jgi:hypothetical protein
MFIGEMVYDLAHSPAAWAVTLIQLAVVQTLNRGAQHCRQASDVRDPDATLGLRDLSDARKPADWIPKVV